MNVAQDVNGPWTIKVYAHNGKAYNSTMEPGDMVLYKSHSVLHGRPFPLNGKFYANFFIHFEPIGHSARHNTSKNNLTGCQDTYLEGVWKKRVGDSSIPKNCQ